jgi:hypothetical protein
MEPDDSLPFSQQSPTGHSSVPHEPIPHSHNPRSILILSSNYVYVFIKDYYFQVSVWECLWNFISDVSYGYCLSHPLLFDHLDEICLKRSNFESLLYVIAVHFFEIKFSLQEFVLNLYQLKAMKFTSLISETYKAGKVGNTDCSVA